MIVFAYKLSTILLAGLSLIFSSRTQSLLVSRLITPYSVAQHLKRNDVAVIHSSLLLNASTLLAGLPLVPSHAIFQGKSYRNGLAGTVGNTLSAQPSRRRVIAGV
jgi:hypothetical protein